MRIFSFESYYYSWIYVQCKLESNLHCIYIYILKGWQLHTNFNSHTKFKSQIPVQKRSNSSEKLTHNKKAELKSIFDVFLCSFNAFKPAKFGKNSRSVLPIFDKTMGDTACLPYVTKKRSVIG